MGRNPPTAVSPSISERGAKAPSTPLALSESSPTPSLGGWCPFAERQVSPNFWPARGGQSVKAVVMHIAEGTYEAALSWLTDPKADVSAHFLVAKDGRIAQFVSIDDSAWGNGLLYRNGQWVTPTEPRVPADPSWSGLIPEVNPNYYTISIEHEGAYTDKWTPAMYAANLQLLQWIRDQTALNYRLHATLIAHSELNAATRKNCPGPNVEWERMARDLAQLPSLPHTALMEGAGKFGVPLDDQAALAQFALAHNLGIPLTDKFGFYYRDIKYIGQVWTLGVVYVQDGEWDRIFLSTG